MNIYINDGTMEIPADETCYIIAKGGIYLRKKLDLIESLTPVDKISFLEDIPVFAKLDIPKISLVMFGHILGFFQEVYRLHHSEAAALIFYNRDKKSYKIRIPEQEVTGASVTYKADVTVKDFIMVGTIHSHANMSAFHSGTDVHDEKNFDGLHVTVGKLKDPPFFDICASVVSNGLRIPVAPEDYIKGLETREYTRWFPTMFKPAFEEVNGEKIYKNTVKSTIEYTLTDSSDEILSFNPSWLDSIKEKVYSYQNYGVTRYIWKDGNLVKVDGATKNKPNAQNVPYSPNYQYEFGFEDYDYYDYSKIRDLKSQKNPCKTCWYRNEKLKLKKSDEEEVLSYNRVEDLSAGYDYFSPIDFTEFD